MKKNIDVVTADSSTLQYLVGCLDHPPEGSPSAHDIRLALENLLSGTSESLLIEAGTADYSSLSRNCISCGALTIEPNSRKVMMNGAPVVLTPKEFDILFLLASNRGVVFTKEQIYQAVWDKDYLLDGSNIMAFIRKLRKKIEPNPDAPEYILTVWGIGYKFADNL